MDGVIIVFDSAEFERRKIRTLLEGMGAFEIIDVPDKNALFSVLREDKDIRLIIMDIACPDIKDGFEVLSVIRAKTGSPLIISTKLDRSDIKTACLEYGVNDYIIKPYKIERLKNSIRSIVKVRKKFQYDLSGIVNVTLSFEEYVGKELKSSERAKHPFSMIVIAPLETRSETHNMGDAIYQNMTDRIKQSLRSTDTVFLNTNGDMFILLPSTDSSKAGMVSVKLEDVLGRCLEKMGLRLSSLFFIVFVTYPEDGDSLQGLLENAFRKIENKKALEEMASVLESEREKARSTYGRYKLT